jgi:hypothetical protein
MFVKIGCNLGLEQAGQSYRGGPVDLVLLLEVHLSCPDPLKIMMARDTAMPSIPRK